MKHSLTQFLLLLLALVLGTNYAAQAQTTYTQVPLTPASFTADVVANGAAAVSPVNSTTADTDGAGFYLISQDYYTNTTPHTSGIPNNGVIQNTLAGPTALTYQLASLSANNSMRIASTGIGTITFATPIAASEINILGVSGSGISTFDVTVNYSNATTTVFPAQTYPDWFGISATQNVFGMTGRGSAATPVSTPYTAANTAPFFDQLRLTIPAAKTGTTITSITFNKTSTTGVLNIMAVTAGVTPLCTAPPTSLATVASTTAAGGTALTTACSSTNIFLSVTGVPTNSGYTYQWQSSTTSATTGFTNIAGATSSTYTATGQTATTYYRVLVSCQFSTTAATASTAVQVAQSPLTACYCLPTYSNGGPSDNIERVRLGALDNNTASLGNPSPYYHDYSPAQIGTGATLAIPNLARGNTATVTLDFGADGVQNSAVWIDFNQDGTFSASEYFTQGTTVGANGTAFIPVVVPATATMGNTRMRVRGGDDLQPTATQACGATGSTFGEAEDYLVNITAACTATSAAFSYGSTSSFCTSGTTNPTVTLASGATAGTFSSTTGLTINATTGAITLSSSTPGTYTVTNTVATSGTNCASGATTTVTITAPATASFSYSSGPYCVSSGTSPAPTLATGATAGTFTSTTGLTIAVNGTITPSSSTPGTYTVTNTVAGGGGCAAATATATIVIRAAPTANFSYPTTLLCANTPGTKTPTLATGATAGTYSLPTATGLSINATTGVVTVGSTATAGTYTVTNTVAAATGCAAVTSTASFTISALPATPTLMVMGTSATGITLMSSSATGNQFYLNGAPVAGATGQNYLVNSGQNNGSYTVTVTNAAGCSATSAPVTVTVTATAPPAANTSLTLYPNPSHDGHLTLELRGYQQAVALEVVNVLGERVYAGAVNGTALTRQQALDLSALPAGVYLLQVRPADGSLETRRFVRE